MARMRLAARVADLLGGRLGLDPDERDVLAYGVEVLAGNLAALGAALAGAALLGCLPEAAAFLAGVGLVRPWAGGAHCSSPGRCAALTGVTVPLLALLAAGLGPPAASWGPWPAAAACGAAVMAIWRLAPVASPERPFFGAAERARFRRLARAAAVLAATGVLAVWRLDPAGRGASLALAGAAGLLWEALVLSRPGHRLVGRVDRLLENLLRR
ncbi:MAG: accessory gene regulator B family protein [Firmicutes bacterium]|nr:accessory gene regulator B family protein [Bacillota bacterium]